ncbi:1-deoxy-D-xylulose 5-phosphate reductoisomerase [Rhodospirillaceae bacterium LM-1]|nr:1-deoxy-D-xylulose 5-phosphate reductoisomerase [Rhodospirillaceae bacterium LM-1]
MVDEPLSVTVLGSTGSIGMSTFDLLARDPQAYRVEALVAGRNVERLIEQAKTLKPKLAVMADPEFYAALKEGLSGTGIEVAAGDDAVIAAADRPAKWVMAAIVGAAGLKPTMKAIQRGAVVGLANKETLVSAGDVVTRAVRDSGAVVIPVDSEHSAIFQVLDFEQKDKVEKIILTASGGPFRTMGGNEMARVTPKQAVAHPNWSMGAKISVDSATMMNKGLELIEAHHLFDMPEEKIDILVHPQSVIHSLVAYVDGSVLAQLGTPDMRTPIAYALGWPRRISAPVPRLNLAEIATLTFERPDNNRFPALELARAALRRAGSMPTILNAANEVAVGLFLDHKIGFLDIARLVAETMEAVDACELQGLEDVLAADAEARIRAQEIARRLTR